MPMVNKKATRGAPRAIGDLTSFTKMLQTLLSPRAKRIITSHCIIQNNIIPTAVTAPLNPMRRKLNANKRQIAIWHVTACIMAWDKLNSPF